MATSSTSDWGFASDLDDVSQAVAIVGIGDADYSKASGRTTHEIAAQATERALADAGLTAQDIDGLMYVPFSGDQFDDVAFHAHFGTAHDLWVSQRGGGMVWAGSAPYDAAIGHHAQSGCQCRTKPGASLAARNAVSTPMPGTAASLSPQ